MNVLKKFSFLILFLGFAQACTTYKPMPLDHSTVAAKLTPPSLEAVRVQAKEIQHPILKPLDFDIANGLSPDDAVILAVLADPKLRSRPTLCPMDDHFILNADWLESLVSHYGGGPLAVEN